MPAPPPPAPAPLPGARGLVKLRYVGDDELPLPWQCGDMRYVFTDKPRYVNYDDSLTMLSVLDGTGKRIFEVAE